MRGLGLAALFVIVFGLSCVSDGSTRSGTPPHAFYPLHPREYVTPGVESPNRSPVRARRLRHHAAWYPRGRRISPRWTTVIIHHSATDGGGARSFDRYHRKSNGWDELGYHFVIGNGTDTPDGFVEVGSRWHKQKHGAHCKTRGNYYNEHGIGICLVGDFTKTRRTARQLASLKRLVGRLRVICHTTQCAVSR